MTVLVLLARRRFATLPNNLSFGHYDFTIFKTSLRSFTLWLCAQSPKLDKFVICREQILVTLSTVRYKTKFFDTFTDLLTAQVVKLGFVTLELSQITEVKIWRIFDIFVLKNDYTATFVTYRDVIACVVEADLCQPILFGCAWKVSVAKSTYVAPLNAFGVIAVLWLWALWTLTDLAFLVDTTNRLVKVADRDLADFGVCGHGLWTRGFARVNDVMWFLAVWALTFSKFLSGTLTGWLIPVLGWGTTIH